MSKQKLVFNIQIDSMFDLEQEIEASIQNEVRRTVKETVEKKVDEQIQKQVGDIVHEIVAESFATKVKIFNYDGSVKDERSFEDALKSALKEIGEKGLDFEVPDSNGYRDQKISIRNLISQDLKLNMTKRLKPQFDIIEKEFQEKSKEALRNFAVQAVDNANQKVLRG